MVQCEMCGSDVSDPNRVKIEGAELDVCDECTDFGTEIRTESSSSTSTKYSTDSSSSSGGSSSSGSSSRSTGTSNASGGGGSAGQEMFDDIDEVAQDYDERIRSARESHGISQEDLAKNLNEKASLIRKLEQGSTLPSDDVQKKIERELDIDLTAGGGATESEWDGGASEGGTTLGDVVERKD